MAAVLAAGLAAACATAPPVRESGPIRLDGEDGPLSSREANNTINTLAHKSGSDNLKRMVSSLNALSDIPLYTDNHVELLIDGPETYRRMLEAIGAAQHYVYLETYIFADDEAGMAFAEALMEKSRASVDVKVIYDSFGSMDSSEAFFERMEVAGVELMEFNEVNPVEGGNPLTLNNRDHRKILVVDGKVAFTGGLNVSSTYSRGSSGRPKPDPIREGWRDTHVEIRGTAVHGFETKFSEHWLALGGEIESREAVESEEKAGNSVVAILSAKGGDNEESNIFAAYIDAMRVAGERIWITQAYFAPDDRFMALLKQAAQRGVDVRLLVPGVSDSSLVLNASRSRYRKMLEAGVRIYENRHDVLHAKTAVIDGVWSTVGSSNLDYRSFLHNDEINAFVLGAEFGEEMEAQFRRDLENAQEIQLEEWNDRSLWQKIKEKLSWTVEYWL
ncbi:MAG: cardiolipin synthase [Xanthomonadales bacterium]|nr:cardiolipin synthase [Xanthomonadales bacterium]